MDVARPYRAISISLDTELLIELSRSTNSRTGRELALAIGRSGTGVRHALDRLVTEGIVRRESAGRSKIYSLNRDHLLANVVEQIAGVRHDLVERLRDLMAQWHVRPDHASLFGSAARGDGDAESDIDILVVRPRGIEEDDMFWSAQLDELSGNVYAWTGNHLGLAEVARNELLQLSYAGKPILEEVRADAIDLAGESLRQLLSGTSG